MSSKGGLTCCGKGGSWFKNCGPAGDPKFDHTWSDGAKACATMTSKPGKCRLHVLDCLFCQRDTFVDNKDKRVCIM